MIFLLLKAKRAQIGEVRHRKSGPYQKVSPTKWIPVKKVGGTWVHVKKIGIGIEKEFAPGRKKGTFYSKLQFSPTKFHNFGIVSEKEMSVKDRQKLFGIDMKLEDAKIQIYQLSEISKERHIKERQKKSINERIKKYKIKAKKLRESGLALTKKKYGKEKPTKKTVKKKKGMKESLDIGKKIGETLTEPTIGKLAETAIGTAKALTPERKKQIVKENKESFHSPSRFINFGNAPKYMPLKDREKLFAIDMKLSDEKYKAENLSRRSTPKSVYKKGDKAIREWRKKNNERIKKYKAKAKELREKGRALKKKHVELSKRPAKKK